MRDERSCGEPQGPAASREGPVTLSRREWPPSGVDKARRPLPPSCEETMHGLPAYPRANNRLFRKHRLQVAGTGVSDRADELVPVRVSDIDTRRKKPVRAH
jgi:hypothetical protein